MNNKSLREITDQLHQIAGYAELLRMNPHKYREYSDLIEQSTYMVDVLARDTFHLKDKPDSYFISKNSSSVNSSVFHGMNVLIVDDFKFNRIILKQIFTTLNCNIICAESGREALYIYENYKPDIVCMDIVMPDMKGDEATRILKKIGCTAKFIAVSAIKEFSQENISLFDAWIQKPYTVDQILNILSSLFINEKLNTDLKKDDSLLCLDELSSEEKTKIVTAIERGALSELEFLTENISHEASKKWLKKQIETLSLQSIADTILSA